MPVRARQKMLDHLKNAIVALERRHVPDAGFADAQDVALRRADGVPYALAGSLNEMWVDGSRDAGAALGFVFAQARGLLTVPRPAVLWLHLSHDGLQTGLPYGPGLSAFGFDPARLVIGRMKRIEDLLWAMEEAIACRSVAAVVADIAQGHKVLDFTVSRRLSLRAQSAGTAVFMVRYGRGREASAARFRWHVAGSKSAEMAFDARAPGAARWQVKLEKGQYQNGTDGGRNTYILKWTKDGFDIDEHPLSAQQEPVVASSLSGAASSPMGDRLSQTA